MKKTFAEFKKTKIGSKIADNSFVLIAVICSALLSILIAFCFELRPFGDRVILRMDLYHQYGPLFAELYERLKGSGGLLYSWCSGGGSSFLGNFYNYLSSPLSLCVIFFGHKNITEAISFMIFTKACLSSGTFSYYIKKSLGVNNYLLSAFGVLYAFSGYFIAYYWNLMWLDAMVLLPLVLLGIERIIKKGKPALYIITLAMTMFSNYYMSYMVCIFSVIYYIFYFFSNFRISDQLNDFRRPLEMDSFYNKGVFYKIRSNRFLNSAIIFGVASLAAAALTAFALLPTRYILSSCSATSGSFPEKLDVYNNVFDFIINHFADLTPTIRSSGDDVLPNIYCGVLTVILIPIFYFTKSISLKEKVGYSCIIAVMFLSFNLNYLNYIWHGLHFPNDLPYRFSFMYTFLILTMGVKAISRIKEISPKIILLCGMGVASFVIIAEKTGQKNLDVNTVFISLAFAVIYTVILYVMTNKKTQMKSISFFLLCLVFCEYAIASTDNYEMNQEKTNYVQDLENFTSLKKQIDNIEKTTYYRMELTNLRTRMDPSWYNYNGVSVFSSMAYEKLSNLQNDLGLAGNFINSYTYNLQTPVYNSMFSLKYIFKNSTDINMNEDLFSKVSENDDFEAYSNNYWLPIAYSCKSKITSWDINTGNPFDVQNQYFELSTGEKNVLKQEKLNDLYTTNTDPIAFDENSDYFYFQKTDTDLTSDITTFFKASETANYYIYVDSGAVDNVTINTMQNTMMRNIGDEEFIIDIGKCEKDEVFSITIPINEDSTADGITLYVYYLDNDKFEKGYNYLNSGSLEIQEFNDTYISGKINVNDNFIYTSIPYDKGWNVEIDGKPVESRDLIIVGGSLLGVKAENGSHTISFKYTPKDLKAGTIISVSTFAVLLLVAIISKKFRFFDGYYILFDKNSNIDLSNYKEAMKEYQKDFAEQQQNTDKFVISKVEDMQITDSNDDINSIL